MYSNSESPTYLMAKLNSNGTITIHDINIFENHKLKLEINLVFDRNGNIVPYNPKKPDLGSHAHHWTEKKEGVMGRDNKPDVNPHIRIPKEYESLINDIIKFNQERKELKS